MNGHRELYVWKTAGDLISVVYSVTSRLPLEEKHVAVPQLRRAAWSVQNNIAEGNARRGRTDRHRFLNTALSSLAEVDSMLAKLADLYGLRKTHLEDAERFRRQITAGLLAMVKKGRS